MTQATTQELPVFGRVRMGVHWCLAAMLLIQIPLAWYMIDLPEGVSRDDNYALHKALGMVIFALAIFRLVWALLSSRPKLPADMALAEKALAKVSQFILYIIVILMPITGWLMSSAAGIPVDVFGLVTLPSLVEPDKTFMEGMQQAHILQSYILLTILGLHVIGALKHGFVDQDNVLFSMLPLDTVKNEEEQ